ncbi:MAG: glycosyltransferase [Pseudomonadota bacterium]
MTTNALRVVHVVTGLGLGGAETVMSRVIGASPDVAHEVISLGGRQWYSAILEERGIPVHHANMHSISPLGLMRIARIIRASRADVVQCWMYRANLVGGLAGRMSGVRSIWNIRVSEPGRLGAGTLSVAYLGGMLERWIPDFVISCSERSTVEHRKLGYGRRPGTVIANGYDPKLLFPDDKARTASRKALGVDRDRFLIGTISRWHTQKDLPTFLKALRLLADRDVPVTCILLGVGLEKSNNDFMGAVAAAGCSDLVVPLGKRGDVPELARAMDLHVLCSIAEGFPNAVAETMLSGTPNVVTDVGDSAMIVADTGWVVRPGDAEALADAMEQAYQELRSAPRKWATRKRKTRDRIADNFSLDRMVDSYKKVWKRFAKRG